MKGEGCPYLYMCCESKEEISNRFQTQQVLVKAIVAVNL